MINYFLTIEEVGLYGIGYQVGQYCLSGDGGFKGASDSAHLLQLSRSPRRLRQLARIFKDLSVFCLDRIPRFNVILWRDSADRYNSAVL